MSYAVRKDGQGFRAVNSADDVDSATETFSDTAPVLVPSLLDARDAANAAIDAQAGATRSKYMLMSLRVSAARVIGSPFDIFMFTF